jgi:hypothetical protein
MKLFKLAVLLVSLMMLSACFEVQTKVKVKPDGSGTIEEQVMISKEVLKELNEIFSGFAALGEQKKKKEDEIVIYDKNKLKEEAINYGQGVKYVSSKKLREKDREGYRVKYSFKDINKVKLNQNPGDRAPQAPGEKGSDTREDITFSLAQGSPAILKINFPITKSEAKKSKSKKARKTKKDKEVTPEELAEMERVLKDMRVVIDVYPQGEIIQTNAMYVDDNKITLMAIDFNQLLADSVRMKEFAQKEPETLEEAKKILKELKGMKIDLNEEITIKFK